MTKEPSDALADLVLDHVVFHVENVETTAAQFVRDYGLTVRERSKVPTRTTDGYSVAVGAGDISVVLTEAVSDDSPVAAYVHAHGDGVADIAMATTDVQAAFAAAVARGARPVAGPAEVDGVMTASIAGFGDVIHTLVQRSSDPGPVQDTPTGVQAIDHFAVCVEAGQLEPTVRFYEHVLGFRTIFAEKIVLGRQSMNSTVVQSVSRSVTLTLIEPDTTRDPGQIDEFLKNHGGAGVQHIALTTDDILASVGALSARGVAFLPAPGTYYELLAERTSVVRHPIAGLRELDILVDEDHDGQLFQIFARSTHPRRTFFLEIIERAGARTFGSGNIKALYEAVEIERQRTSVS